MPKGTLVYKRVLLKLSGEIFAGEKRFGIDPDMLSSTASQIAEIASMCQVAIVIGGGNFFRGVQDAKTLKIDRVVGDYVGMLSTVINSLILQNALEVLNKPTRVMSAIEVSKLAEPYIRRRAIRHLEKGRIVLFSCGTGNPYFTTDTAAVLRAIEVSADAVIKGTKVDGVYSADPVKNKNSRFLTKLSYKEVLDKQLRIMDLTAITLCSENKLPIVVFNIKKEGNLKKVIQGKHIGTIIR
jgi:uridylate kinase